MPKTPPLSAKTWVHLRADAAREVRCGAPITKILAIYGDCISLQELLDVRKSVERARAAAPEGRTA